MDQEDQRNHLAQRLNEIVSAEKPQTPIPENLEHPSTTIHQDDDIDLANLVENLQSHKCKKEYCEKRGECRFGYPKLNNIEGQFKKIRGNWTFEPARNSPRTVPYNTLILKYWRSNIDVTVVSSTEVLITYITKYITKSDQSSLMQTMYFFLIETKI